MYGARKVRLRRLPSPNAVTLACTSPLTYVGHSQIRADIDNLKAAMKASKAEEGFITALSPTNIEFYYENRYYQTQEEFLYAICDAMREEYKAVIEAGLLLQIDDPRLITYWDRNPSVSPEENRRFITQHVDALNHALRGLPEDRIRFHTCYSTNVAPRVADLELKDYVDEMLRIRAGAYSIEASNPRHEHEWQVWEDTKLPDGKILIPGVISHCVYQVEHPELVAQRIVRFADVVGRERVIASNDCGFATSAAGDEVHPSVAWAKMEALVEGAEIATHRLWGRR
jgi:5-methyltetrahydropteroyltriglutamate--homocysteine methyltransferase